MPDRPINMRGPEVRALLDGRKTQTRRVLKAQPQAWAEAVEIAPYYSGGGAFGKPGSLIQRTRDDRRQHGCGKLLYAPGDRLWVREAWNQSGLAWPVPRAGMGRLHYRADPDHGCKDYWGAWRSPIHMPRWASRLTLTVTQVRVQRLQDISEEDAQAEGAQLSDQAKWGGLNHRFPFEVLWNSLHGPGAWDANPWVAAITFTVHRSNIDAMP